MTETKLIDPEVADIIQTIGIDPVKITCIKAGPPVFTLDWIERPVAGMRVIYSQAFLDRLKNRSFVGL